jgi:hypothetical protein
MASNERKACDAVARILEERNGVSRANAYRPDSDSSRQAVDYAFEISGQSFALEHTTVEAFNRQIHMSADFMAFAFPIQEELATQMPRPGIYYLDFPIEPCATLSRSDWTGVRSEIIEWVRAAALELHAEAPIRKDRNHAPHGHNGRCEATVATVRLVLRRVVHWA